MRKVSLAFPDYVVLYIVAFGKAWLYQIFTFAKNKLAIALEKMSIM